MMLFLFTAFIGLLNSVSGKIAKIDYVNILGLNNKAC